MSQLRPTFSESWYRVVTLKPKLRGTAQISRQYYRGERWYVVRDPAGNQFHRLSDAAYRFVGLLDGRRTVGEAAYLSCCMRPETACQASPVHLCACPPSGPVRLQCRTSSARAGLESNVAKHVSVAHD